MRGDRASRRAARASRHVLRGLVIAAAAIACGGSKPAGPTIATFRLIATHPLAVTEPSDLALDAYGGTLWTVSNHPARVYQLDRDGNVLKTLKYQGQDLEGIAFDPLTHTLWVTEERNRDLVQLSLDGDVLGRHRLDLPGKPNSGPEGVCLDERGRMFLVNEKDPGLFIELDRNLGISARRPLSFAGDYSAISSSRQKGCFWIVSDKSQMLYLWSKPRGVIEEFPLSFTKAEGVAVDEAAKLIYIVSESGNALYVFQM